MPAKAGRVFHDTVKFPTLHHISLPYISLRSFHVSDQNQRIALRKPINPYE
ncbi:tagatose-bisphosphate aldolase, partial [Escherichia coli]|nr:tagatose-bisphosphate aldolase [Escherichia coli]